MLRQQKFMSLSVASTTSAAPTWMT